MHRNSSCEKGEIDILEGSYEIPGVALLPTTTSKSTLQMVMQPKVDELVVKKRSHFSKNKDKVSTISSKSSRSRINNAQDKQKKLEYMEMEVRSPHIQVSNLHRSSGTNFHFAEDQNTDLAPVADLDSPKHFALSPQQFQVPQMKGYNSPGPKQPHRHLNQILQSGKRVGQYYEQQ